MALVIINRYEKDSHIPAGMRTHVKSVLARMFLQAHEELQDPLTT